MFSVRTIEFQKGSHANSVMMTGICQQIIGDTPGGDTQIICIRNATVTSVHSLPIRFQVNTTIQDLTIVRRDLSSIDVLPRKRANPRDSFNPDNPSACYICVDHICVDHLGSTLYSEGSFVRRFFSPKPFEVLMVRRTYSPTVLYSEVPLLRKLLCSEDSIFRKALHYMDSIYVTKIL